MKFTIEKNDYCLDGQPIKIYAGAIHYFRLLPQYWEERLMQLKALGFNTLETYIPWNLHQPTEDTYEFTGMADVEAFIRLAGSLDLHVIVRPTPYICSEWEFGGLPWWLLKNKDIELRCMHPDFLQAVDTYFTELMPRLAALQITRGGPIIAMQVENEYGSYGDDQAYLRHMKDTMEHHGVDVLLFTSDGGTDHMLTGGTLPDVFKTANFGSRPQENFDKLREHQPEGPLTCMEYWNGWFDHWGEQHHSRPADEVAQCFDEMVTMGASVNFYMLHGGTNFGFMAGANWDGVHQPTITSYDNNAPIGESGNLTEKYYAVQQVMDKYFGPSGITPPQPSPAKAFGTLELTEAAPLFDNLPDVTAHTAAPLNMEQLDQGYGYVLYRAHVRGPREALPLSIQEPHDRALVYANGHYLGTYKREIDREPVMLSIPQDGLTLDILLENCGRINYGSRLKDFKGITQGVRLNRQFLFGWDHYSLPMDSLDHLQYIPASQHSTDTPAFYRGSLMVDTPAHTFIQLDGWHKGQIYVNGFNIGRHYHIGPQKTYFIPGALLREGANEIIVFDQRRPDKLVVRFLDQENLG